MECASCKKKTTSYEVKHGCICRNCHLEYIFENIRKYRRNIAHYNEKMGYSNVPQLYKQL